MECFYYLPPPTAMACISPCTFLGAPSSVPPLEGPAVYLLGRGGVAGLPRRHAVGVGPAPTTRRRVEARAGTVSDTAAPRPLPERSRWWTALEVASTRTSACAPAPPARAMGASEISNEGRSSTEGGSGGGARVGARTNAIVAHVHVSDGLWQRSPQQVG